MSKYSIEDTTLTGIADAVRAKEKSTDPILTSEIANRINSLDVEEDYEWRKPPDWPDLESIEMPNSWDTNTLYFLFDKKCGVDNVAIYCSASNKTAHKGYIVDGEFIETEPLSFISNKLTDILIDEYTIYKVTCTGKNALCRFDHDTKLQYTYAWCNQGCVWIFAEIPTFGDVGGDSTASMLTPYMKRINFTHVATMYPTFPENLITGSTGFDISVSYVCGYTEPNDWANLPMKRTGNGPITPPIKQKSNYVVKHVNFQNTYTRAPISARNVILIEPTGVFKNQQYQDCTFIESFVVKGGTMKCSSMSYQFYNAQNIHTIDLSDVDFSECTGWANIFNNCKKLETLKLSSTWTGDLELGSCPSLSKESVIGIFNVLPTVETAKIIRLRWLMRQKLTDEEIAIATNKGWTVKVA